MTTHCSPECRREIQDLRNEIERLSVLVLTSFHNNDDHHRMQHSILFGNLLKVLNEKNVITDADVEKIVKLPNQEGGDKKKSKRKTSKVKVSRKKASKK